MNQINFIVDDENHQRQLMGINEIIKKLGNSKKGPVIKR